MESYIDLLNPREAKMLNTYVNCMNIKNEEYKNKGLYDDDTYKHDEYDIDYKAVLKTKLEYIPKDYEKFINTYRNETENLTIAERYHEACKTIYWLSYILEHINTYRYDLYDEVGHCTWNFMKYVDDFVHMDEFEKEFDKQENQE